MRPEKAKDRVGDITDSEADFFWLCGEGNNDGSKPTSASRYCVTSHVLNREYYYDDAILTSVSMYYLWFMPQTYVYVSYVDVI